MTNEFLKTGSRWTAADGNVFHVMNVVEIDGKTWVHYEQDNIEECKTFSCYVESFLARFVPLTNEYRRG